MAGLVRAGVSGWHGGLRFPNASNTGAVLAGPLTAVPGSATSGSNWSWNAGTSTMTITGSGTVTGLAVTGTVKISASNVTLSNCSVTNGVSVIGTSGSPRTGCTISNCVIVTAGGGSTEAVMLQFTTGTTIKDCTISGSNATSGRASYGIDDNQSMDAVSVLRCNIFWARVSVSVSEGLVQDCYIHDPGFITGDHTDGIDFEGSSGPMSITHNTILLNMNQTAPVHMNSTFSLVTGVKVSGNLLAGGDYAIYGGNGGTYITNNPGAVPSGIVVTGNWFSTAFYQGSGFFGPVSHYAASGPGNAWSGNYWYDGPSAGIAVTP